MAELFISPEKLEPPLRNGDNNKIYRYNKRMKKLFGKLFGGAGVSIAEKLGGVVDKFVRTKDEKAEFEKQMTEIFMSHELSLEKEITSRHAADMQSDRQNLLVKAYDSETKRMQADTQAKKAEADTRLKAREQIFNRVSKQQDSLRVRLN